MEKHNDIYIHPHTVFKKNENVIEKKPFIESLSKEYKSVLVPYQQGVISLQEDYIQKRLAQDFYPKGVKSFISKNKTKDFAFVDFIMIGGYDSNHGEITYAGIIARIKKAFNVIQDEFEKSFPGVDSQNHNLLEHQFMSDGYTLTVENGKESEAQHHLVLFSAVDKKETISSRQLRYPNLVTHPGEVVKMVMQGSEALKALILNTDIFGNDSDDRLLPSIPGLSLDDIWIFGKWYYKFNWAFCFENTDTRLLLPATKKRLGNNLSSHDFYHVCLSSLGLLAILFLKRDFEISDSYSDNIKEIKKHLETSFMCEFKDEGELLADVIGQLLGLPENHSDSKGPFDVLRYIDHECKNYRERNPTSYLLMTSLEKDGKTMSFRLEQIQKDLMEKDIPRGHELHVIMLHKFLTGDPNAKIKNYSGEFNSKLNDPTDPSYPKEQKNPAPPFLEVYYPLNAKDVDSIIQSPTEPPKIFCQVHPLFEKDFFVYRAFTSQLVLSIEFNDDLTYLLSSISQGIGYINAELDQERRVVFRSALNQQAFENELESHINAFDTLALIVIIVVRKINFCIEYEEFGRITKNVRLILDEIDYHLQNYRSKRRQLESELKI